MVGLPKPEADGGESTKNAKKPLRKQNTVSDMSPGPDDVVDSVRASRVSFAFNGKEFGFKLKRTLT